jgi:hypothetical protein
MKTVDHSTGDILTVYDRAVSLCSSNFLLHEIRCLILLELVVQAWEDTTKSSDHMKMLHMLHRQSFIKSYPLVCRETTLLLTEPKSNESPNKEPEQSDFSPAKNIHLGAYHAWVKSGGRLCDGTENMTVHSIVAVQPERKNADPWFGRVISVLHEQQQVQLKWLHSSSKVLYYYADDQDDIVAFDAIICNGVSFIPKRKTDDMSATNTTMMWKLLTPLQVIKAMNTDQIPHLRPVSTITPVTKSSVAPFPELFSCKESFDKFINKF